MTYWLNKVWGMAHLADLAFALTPEEIGEHMLHRYGHAARAARSRKSRPVILHIGPSALQDWELVLYQSMLSAGPFRLFFVEPNPRCHVRLSERTRSVGVAEENLEIVSAAVCVGDAREVDFFRYSEQLLWDFPSMGAFLKTLDEKGTLEGKAFLFNSVLNEKSLWGPRMDGQEPNWDRYIEHISVPCMTPSTLLSRVAVRPEELDMVIVDAEGQDVNIVYMLLTLTGFAPAVLQLEHMPERDGITGSHERKAHVTLQIMSALVALNYSMFRMGVDIVALASWAGMARRERRQKKTLAAQEGRLSADAPETRLRRSEKDFTKRILKMAG